MSRLFHPLLLLIANSTEHRLARHVQYLSEELSILRARLPERNSHHPKNAPVCSSSANRSARTSTG